MCNNYYKLSPGLRKTRIWMVPDVCEKMWDNRQQLEVFIGNSSINRGYSIAALPEGIYCI